MSDDATPRLGLPYLAAAQAQKHVKVNEGLALLDGLVQTAVASRSAVDQPESPADGVMYILPESATGGDWAGHPAGTVMRFEAGAWRAITPGVGWLAMVTDPPEIVAYGTSGWVGLGSLIGSLANLSTLGVNTTADSINKLAVKSDTILFDHAGAGVQLKLDKAAASDTTSVLFQTGYGGRAEIGLCGDDHLHIRTSPDGATFTDALVIDTTSGSVGLGTLATDERLNVDGGAAFKATDAAALTNSTDVTVAGVPTRSLIVRANAKTPGARVYGQLTVAQDQTDGSAYTHLVGDEANVWQPNAYPASGSDIYVRVAGIKASAGDWPGAGVRVEFSSYPAYPGTIQKAFAAGDGVSAVALDVGATVAGNDLAPGSNLTGYAQRINFYGMLNGVRGDASYVTGSPWGELFLQSASAAAKVLIGPGSAAVSGALSIGGASGPSWSAGTGSPNGAVTAPIGSLFSNLTGGAGATLWVKESGSDSTGWVAK